VIASTVCVGGPSVPTGSLCFAGSVRGVVVCAACGSVVVACGSVAVVRGSVVVARSDGAASAV